MKQLVLICSFFTLLFSACNQDGTTTGGGIFGGGDTFDGYVINGTISNAGEGSSVFLDDLAGQRVNVIDTAILDANGQFEMRGKVSEKALGRLRVGTTPSNVLLVIDNERMTVNFDVQDRNTYNIDGSSESKQLQDLVERVVNNQTSEEYLSSYVDTSKNLIAAYFAAQRLKAEDHYESFVDLSNRMQTSMPNSPLTKQFATHVKSQAAALKTRKGQPAPEIQLESPNGEVIPLSSLKGKVVLIDFWASWCRPCRRENPNVVRAYKEYKDKGFDVYSVSLDKSKEKWEKAIKDDNLTWKNHVSDLAGWQSSAAALYSVKSIPQTFLIDKNGIIVDRNLRGAALDNKLAELLD